MPRKSYGITYLVLISHCFALHPYEKHELIKPEWVIIDKTSSKMKRLECGF